MPETSAKYQDLVDLQSHLRNYQINFLEPARTLLTDYVPETGVNPEERSLFSDREYFSGLSDVNKEYRDEFAKLHFGETTKDGPVTPDGGAVANSLKYGDTDYRVYASSKEFGGDAPWAEDLCNQWNDALEARDKELATIVAVVKWLADALWGVREDFNLTDIESSRDIEWAKEQEG